MAKEKAEDRFCFTWGLKNLHDLGFVPLYAFMLRTYARLGLSRQEMLCIIHLASYHYNSPGGESRPSLETVAGQMGYAHKQRVSEIVSNLEDNGRLIVTRRPGFTSVYNAYPFAKAAYDLWIQLEAQKQKDSVTLESNTPIGSVTLESNTPIGSVTLESNGGLRSSVTEEYEKEEEIEGEEELILSPAEKDKLSDLWSLFLDALSLTMAKTTFDNLLRGSRLVGAVNGTWRVEVRNPWAVEWLDKRLAPSKAFQTVLAREAPQVEHIEFFAKEDTHAE